MAERIPKSQTLRVPLNAVLASDHYSAATGKTIVIKISKNGAAFANPSAGATTATEIGSGGYYVDLAAADTNTLGPLIVLGTSATIDNIIIHYDVVALPSAAAELTVITASAPTGTNFLTPIDIGNRALQHCGAKMMDPALGFTEVSKNARQVSFCYPKLRRAELRRNVWRFATRRAALRAIDTDTLLLTPSMWVASTTYFVGSIVADENGTLWISTIPNNLNYEPQNSAVWMEYFGPLTVMLYDSTTTYFAGELVYTAAGAGKNRVYISLQNANADNPATATAWSATATYIKNQVVTYSSIAYMSLIDLNIGQTPSSAPALFNIATTYGAGASVGASDGVIYTSVAGGNVGHDPTTDSGVHWTDTGVLNPWTRVFVGGAGSLKWLQIGGAEFPMGVTVVPISIIYPIGAGPSSQSATRNVFRLPAGYLRTAPQEPKAGSSWAPSGLMYTDWVFEGNYIVSTQAGPILLRFVADTVDVTAMDDMFCEGLAARIGLEVCEPLTQSGTKLKTIASEYEKFMGEARTVNAIEIGSEEPPLDDFIACRA